MNNKEYNQFINDISTCLSPLNQILYQIFTLITLHILFTKIQTNYSIHKSFVILYALLIISLDWFIWNNVVNTGLFICILLIYIKYNQNYFNLVDTFYNNPNILLTPIGVL